MSMPPERVRTVLGSSSLSPYDIERLRTLLEQVGAETQSLAEESDSSLATAAERSGVESLRRYLDQRDRALMDAAAAAMWVDDLPETMTVSEDVARRVSVSETTRDVLVSVVDYAYEHYDVVRATAEWGHDYHEVFDVTFAVRVDGVRDLLDAEDDLWSYQEQRDDERHFHISVDSVDE
jgi:hypothetical protein